MIRPEWDKTDPLVLKVLHRLTRTVAKSHIHSQVHTALDLYTATGKGVKILEHYCVNNMGYLKRVFYLGGMVYDYNDLPTERWSKANRHNEWRLVSKFDAKSHPKYKILIG